MFETMYQAPGIGLAAPQVGTLLRLVVVDLQKDDTPDPMVLVNPEIVAASKELAAREEGCLSLPGQFAEVTRPAKVRVRFLDQEGAARELEADGLPQTTALEIRDGRIGVIYVVRNPEKLAAVRSQLGG